MEALKIQDENTTLFELEFRMNYAIILKFCGSDSLTRSWKEQFYEAGHDFALSFSLDTKDVNKFSQIAIFFVEICPISDSVIDVGKVLLPEVSLCAFTSANSA